MSTNDSHKLKHSAMVKNASPHMNGGGPHIQIQRRPAVTANDGNVVVRRAAQQQQIQQGARPVKKIRMGENGPEREVEIGGGNGASGAATQEGVGVNKYGKKMILVRMDGNGKARRDNGRAPGGRMQRVALPGRGASPKNDPRFRNLIQQKQLRQQQQNGQFAAALPEGEPIAFSGPRMSNEQLMLCRYAVKKYAEADGNELTAELCAGTLKTIDAIMASRKGEPVEIEEPEIEAEPIVPVAIDAGRIAAEPNQLTPEQLAELEQFEAAQQQARKARPSQGAVKPFAARPPAKPAPIDTEPEPDSPKGE